MNAEQKQRATWENGDDPLVSGGLINRGIVDFVTLGVWSDKPVGYLYTHVYPGEYHISEYDDDYKGPERAMWHIEPVYRRTKG